MDELIRLKIYRQIEIYPSANDLQIADVLLQETWLDDKCSPTQLGLLLAILTNKAWEWSQQTFGKVEQRGPKGALLHMEKEAREAINAIGTSDLDEELADCQLLIWDAAQRAGLGPVELLESVFKKLQKNMAREWPAPTADQPVEHIREGESHG